MKRTSSLCRVIGTGLALAVAGTGCTHNYYYGTAAGCPPLVGSTVSTQVGQVCDVAPTTAPAPIVSSTVVPGQSVVVTPNSQRVVTSLPTSRPTLANRLSGWRAPAPEVARISVEGALESSTVDR